MNKHISPAVEMQYMRPRQLEEALLRFPAVYVPFGLIEWHGPHLPLGNDAIKAHAFCKKAAEQSGGVVYPPVYFAESLPHELLGPLLTQFFFKLKYAGARVILVVSGHNSFTQLDLLREALAPVLAKGGVAADAVWEFETDMKQVKSVKYMPDGRLFVDGAETTVQRDAESCSDHAAKWETSNIMHLYPELVDMRELGTEPFPLDMSAPWGIGGLDPRKHASAEVGRRNLALAAAYLARRARELLASLPPDQRTFTPPAISPSRMWGI